MADKPQPISLLAKLTEQVRSHDTVTTLFKLAHDPDFQAETKRLSPEDLKILRQTYKDAMRDLDGKVKLQDYVGQTLNITDVSFWHSAQWDNDGVTLRFNLDNSSQTYKALTSSAVVVRFATQLDPTPTPEHPVRILLGQKAVSDKQRAAQGQKIFTVKRLATPTVVGDGSDGAPF